MADFFQASKRRCRQEEEELGTIMEPAILSVEGRGFNEQIHYVEEPVTDYLRAAVSTVLSIHDQEPMVDIVVFLTGQDDIDAAVQLLTEETQNRRKNSSGSNDLKNDLIFWYIGVFRRVYLGFWLGITEGTG